MFLQTQNQTSSAPSKHTTPRTTTPTPPPPTAPPRHPPSLSSPLQPWRMRAWSATHRSTSWAQAATGALRSGTSRATQRFCNDSTQQWSLACTQWTSMMTTASAWSAQRMTSTCTCSTLRAARRWRTSAWTRNAARSSTCTQWATAQTSWSQAWVTRACVCLSGAGSSSNMQEGGDDKCNMYRYISNSHSMKFICIYFYFEKNY